MGLNEHRSSLKNYRNRYYPRLIFTTKTGKNSLKDAFCFYGVVIMNNFESNPRERSRLDSYAKVYVKARN